MSVERRDVKRTLTLAALNAHSLGAAGRLSEIEWLLRERRIDVLAVSETWQKPGEQFEVSGYRFVGKPRETKAKVHGGGVGFFIADHLRFKIREPNTTIPENCEMFAISLCVRGQQNIHIVSTYIPPHESLPKGQAQFEPSTFARCFPVPRSVFLGDFNAYHKDWSIVNDGSSNYAKKRGAAIRRYARQKGMSVFGFRETPTHISTRGRMASPDLLMAGGDIAPAVLFWETLKDVGSDHLPIAAELCLDAQGARAVKRAKRWEGKTLKIEEYQKEIGVEMAEWTRESAEGKKDLNTLVEDWGKRVLRACEKTCQTRYIGHKPGVGFMCRDLKELLRKKNRARKKSQKHRTQEAVNEFQKLQKEARKALSDAKKDEHEHFCNSFTEENAHAKVKQVKERLRLPTCIHTEGGTILTDEKEIADYICNYFASVGRGEQRAHEGVGEKEREGAEEKKDGLEEESFHTQITLSEVEAVVKKLKVKKAAGPDGICPWMIKHGGEAMLQSLLVIMQACWEQGSIPEAWRRARIQPLMKHSASRRADELRPISLLSVVSKLYDSIVLERLQRVSEAQGWIPDYQAGFRRHRSAIEHLIRIQQEGHTAFREGKIMMVAFLDISKAYDCVSRPLLLKKLKGLGIQGRALKYLEAFLGKRYAWVTYKNADSDITEFKYGVPQGSPISPFLFNVYCAAALSECGQGRGLQADDMCVWRIHKQEEVACRELTADLKTVFEWGKKHNMRFSKKKCKVLRISNKHKSKLEKYPIVFFGGQVLELVESHKYLGVIIDSKLRWREHIIATAEKAEKSLRLILRLCNTRRGVSQRLLILLYESCVRPILEYASEVWGDVSKTNAQRLTTVQHHALKASLGVNRRSHTADVCVEAQVPPLEPRRKIQVLRFWKNLHLHPRPLTRFLMELPGRKRLQNTLRSSFLERVEKIMKETNFSQEKVLSLKKEQYKTCERSLWKKQRQQRGRRDDRSAHYSNIQSKTELQYPADYRKTRRKTVAEWHGLRLGTIPLNKFLQSIGRHSDGQCDCGKGEETVEHFLLHCESHTEATEKLTRQIKKSFNTQAQPSLARILSTDNRSFKAVSTFLEEVTRFEPP